jgi:hypothetical protein
MDDQRFDELSKKLATSVSRRQAIRIMGTTAVGGLGALFGARGAFAHHNANCRNPGDNCRSNAECCSGICTEFHCACPSGTVVCQDACVPACSPPFTLNLETCQCECAGDTTECGLTCCFQGHSCCGTYCCPPNTTCSNCFSQACCIGSGTRCSGQSCTSNSQCCSGQCNTFFGSGFCV